MNQQITAMKIYMCTHFNKTVHKILTISLSISNVKLSEKILHFKNVPKTFDVWK